MADEVHHDIERQRFSIAIDGADAHLDYHVADADTLDLAHTYVSPHARGRGVASRLTRAALDHARADGKRVIPSCSYVALWIRRYPEYGDLVV